MSLYFEAAAILANSEAKGGSLKNRIFGKKDLKSPPGAVYAVIAEATKWSSVLKEVVERSEVLKHEKKLNPTLALLLTHDLLLAKKGVAAPKQHVLNQAISRHKNRLSAEFTKCRIRRGFPTVEAFRTHINTTISEDDDAEKSPTGNKSSFHPRWVRINAIKSNLEQALSSTFYEFTKVPTLKDLATTPKGLYIDTHIPNLIAIHPSADFSKHAAYRAGQIIFQDKASCFPAYLLDPQPADGQVIDACAAPGNKTTHLAAIMAPSSSSSSSSTKSPSAPKVTACERNPARAQILQKMVKLAGADKVVNVKSSQDFIKLDPKSSAYEDVGALLLDPSCSGSGIIGRDETAVLHLPLLPSEIPAAPVSGKKRKRKGGSASASAASAVSAISVPAAAPVEEETNEEISEETPEHETDAEKLKTRLTNLAGFQLKIVLHAFSFPNATKVTYSTCSVHAEENEQVVVRALRSRVAREMGWRILKREDQVEGMRKWERRGEDQAMEGLDAMLAEVAADREEVREACIRCERGTDEGTMGFFVAGFVRDADAGQAAAKKAPAKKKSAKAIETPAKENVEEEETDDGGEWGGFSDNEA